MGILLSLIGKPAQDKKQVETSLIEEFYYPKYGPGQMWETLAEKISASGGKIILDRQVEKLQQQSDKTYLVTARDTAGEKYNFTAEIIISSMPICDLVRSLDNVPEQVYDVATKLPYRDFITVGLLCKKLLLKNDTKFKTVGDIVPDCWIYVQEHGVKLGRLQIFNNWSPYLVKDLEHTVWIGLEYFCNEGDHLWEMSDDEFSNFAIQELESIDLIRKEDVLDWRVVRVEKAYPAYFGAYAEFGTV